MLPKQDHTVVTVMGDHLVKMLQHHLSDQSTLRPFEPLFDLGEDPGVSDCCPADHHPVAPRLFEYLTGFAGRIDVPIGDDGDGDGLFGFRDRLIVDRSLIFSGTRTSMYGDKVRPRLFAHPGDLCRYFLGHPEAHFDRCE